MAEGAGRGFDTRHFAALGMAAKEGMMAAKIGQGSGREKPFVCEHGVKRQTAMALR